MFAWNIISFGYKLCMKCCMALQWWCLTFRPNVSWWGGGGVSITFAVLFSSPCLLLLQPSWLVPPLASSGDSEGTASSVSQPLLPDPEYYMLYNDKYTIFLFLKYELNGYLNVPSLERKLTTLVLFENCEL